jgi:hypothetical protein
MRLLYLFSALAITLINAWPDPPCRTPPPAAGYTIEQVNYCFFSINKSMIKYYP